MRKPGLVSALIIQPFLKLGRQVAESSTRRKRRRGMLQRHRHSRSGVLVGCFWKGGAYYVKKDIMVKTLEGASGSTDGVRSFATDPIIFLGAIGSWSIAPVPHLNDSSEWPRRPYGLYGSRPIRGRPVFGANRLGLAHATGKRGIHIVDSKTASQQLPGGQKPKDRRGLRLPLAVLGAGSPPGDTELLLWAKLLEKPLNPHYAG
jgi:hypothetical protein